MIEEILEEIKRKAKEGDETSKNFLELFSQFPENLKENAMKCAIEINLELNKEKGISEEKLLEIARKWKVEEVLEREIFEIQLQKYFYKAKEN